MSEIATEIEATHWDRRRAAIALRVEQTALKLFLRHGVEAVTVDQIAEAADISQRTFFRYFPSRDDILAAAPSRNLAHMVTALRARPANEHILSALEASVVREDDLPPAERDLLRLNRQVMRKEPHIWTHAVRRMQLSADDALMRAIEERLHGDKAQAAALSGVLAHTFRSWLEGGRFGSFAVKTEHVLRALQNLLTTYDTAPRGD